jgi:hypothetical protein
MYSFRQGYCLIFDNDKFDDHLELSDRAGSVEDRQLMEAVFTEHNFQVSLIQKIPSFSSANGLHNTILPFHRMEQLNYVMLMFNARKF